MELLAPVGSPDTVEAAVQGGANAVYLGYGDFNARRNAKNFTLPQLGEAVDYCHLRGVSVFLTLNTLLRQRELPAVEAMLRQVIPLGIDAVIVQDLALLPLVQQLAPSLEIHASTQCTIHSWEGVQQAVDLGFSRVVLSRELSRGEMEYIAARSPIPLEVFVHGAMCMSYSGQCFFSGMIGERSGNRGLCAQPCRLDYGWDGGKPQGEYPLSLKDMSLGHQLQELQEMGIASLKIEGRMKRPEYVAIVTKIYATALREGRSPTAQEQEALALAFSRQGFTDGYYQGKTGAHMFGTRQAQEEPKDLFAQARREYQGKEQVKIPVKFRLQVEEEVQLQLTDPQGNQVEGRLSGVEEAKNKALSPEVATEQLQRTGGTPFTLEPEEIHIRPGVALPLSRLNQLRRELLQQLGEQRVAQGRYTQDLPPVVKKTPSTYQGKPKFTAWVLHARQITASLLAFQPECLYIPLHTSPQQIQQCQERGVTVALQLPAIASDQEREALLPLLEEWKQRGVQEALVGSLDSYHWAQSLGFSLRGDYGLPCYNDHSLEGLSALQSAVPSMELSFPQIRDLDKSTPLELLAYGHLPLMITKNCIIGRKFGNTSQKGRISSACQKGCGGACKEERGEAHSLHDRKNLSFPVETTLGGRSMIYNSLPLYLADKQEECGKLGLWGLRLSFTRESPQEIEAILQQYQGKTKTLPPQFTRGLYYRGVE